MVKSDLLIGVKLKHVLTMCDKSPGIRRPLYKETDIVPNDCCRICRIYVKVSGRSKMNFFLGIITRIFHKHCHLFCRQCARGKLWSLKESINRAYCIICFCGARRSRRFAGIPFKIVILICILAIWLAFWFSGSISFFCGTTTLGRVMQHNKPLMFGMYFQRFLLTQ